MIMVRAVVQVKSRSLSFSLLKGVCIIVCKHGSDAESTFRNKELSGFDFINDSSSSFSSIGLRISSLSGETHAEIILGFLFVSRYVLNGNPSFA